MAGSCGARDLQSKINHRRRNFLAFRGFGCSFSESDRPCSPIQHRSQGGEAIHRWRFAPARTSFICRSG